MPDIRVNLPDGNVVSFPDGTSNEVMEGAIRGYLKMPSSSTAAAANTEAAMPSKGETRPSSHSVLADIRTQIINPALQVGQQTWGAIKDIPNALMPGFSSDELQKGKELISALPFQGNQEPPKAAAYIGAGLRRTGQLANDALGVVSSPFNLATASIQNHIQNILQPWQDLARKMYGKDAQPDPSTGRYTTGNDDLDKAIDNVIGAVPFLMTSEAGRGSPTPLEHSLEEMKNRAPLRAPSKQAPIDPELNARMRQALALPNTSSEIGDHGTILDGDPQIDLPVKTPTEMHSPQTVSGATKSGDVPVIDRQALIAPEPRRFAGQEPLKQLPSPSKEVGPSGVGTEPPILPPVLKPLDIPKKISDLHTKFDFLADLNRQQDLAESDTHAENLGRLRTEAEGRLTNSLRNDLGAAKAGEVKSFREQVLTEAAKQEAQGKAMQDLTDATIKNRGVKAEIVDLRKTGGPPRKMEVGQVTDERGIPRPVIATNKEIAKASRSARSVFDEIQGRVPLSEFNNLQVMSKPEGVSDAEWHKYVGDMQVERQELKKKISDAVTMAADTGSSIFGQDIEAHVDRLKEIEETLGKYVQEGETNQRAGSLYAQEAEQHIKSQEEGGKGVPGGPGRRPNIPPELDENGAIKAPEVLKSWSLDRARLALGKEVKQMPTDEQFYQHAAMRTEKGRLFRVAADVAREVLADKKREGERGGLGEVGVKGEVKHVSLADQVPSDQEIMKRALAAKIFAHTVDDDFPAGRVGLLSKDGKTFIDSTYATHSDTADTLLPEIKKLGPPNQPYWDGPLTALINKGWIRKGGPLDWEAQTLDRPTLHTIEMDLLRNGKYGLATTLESREIRGPAMTKGYGFVELEHGWDQHHDSLQEAVEAAKRRQGWSNQTGALKGVTLATSSTIGGIVGTVVGAHLGHPLEGGAIGWGLGFVSPAIANHPLFWKAVNGIKPAVTSFGISMHDWLAGPKQLDAVNPDMKPILDAQQRDLKGPTKSLLTRIAQLPGDIQHKMFDKFIFISDRPGAVSKFLMQFDQRGQAFRDLRGKLDVDNSPYVSAWLAAGGGGGMTEAHLLDYKRMYSEAQSKGLVNNVNEYLNLKGYQRVYDVMTERIQDANDAINKTSQALQQKGLPLEVEAGLRKALRGAKAEKQDVIDKLTSKTLVPQPYDPPKIANDLQAMQAKLGPKFQDVQNLAGRVFALNRKVLDMVHGAGIVGDADYQKYTARGDEYIPMHRIMEQVADNTGRTSGTGSPLYLRQQNVVKALMGSERVNRDPVIASADANLEALREVMRNGVIRDYLKLAQADPQGVGTYFKQVTSGYKAKPDEGLVGFYQDGIQHTIATPSWLAESLKNVSPAAMDVIGKGPLQMFSKILRQGATMGNLAWSVPNALRHLGDMAIMSDAGLKDIRTLPKDAAGLVRDWTKSVYGSIMQDPVWQEYMRSGAAYSTLQRMISPEDHLDPKTLGFKQKVAHGRVIDVVQDFNAAVEDATKMTTYRRLRQAGYSEKGAAWETRRYGGGPDFAKGRNLSPAINLVSMFFQAHLQYVSRVFARAAENPARVAIALGAITGMAMSLNEWNWQQKDEKGNLLMRKVPYTDRENNFVVLSRHTYQSTSGATLPIYYKVPKASFVKFLYNPIENMLNKVAGHEERSGTQLGLQALGNLLPGQMDLQQGEIGKSAVRGAVSSLNPVIRTPLEEAMNYKTTGFGAPIVPGPEMGIDRAYQYGPGTSMTAQRIGQGGIPGAKAGGAAGASIGYLLGGPKGAALGGGLGTLAGSFGVSPRRAEHVIDTTTAGVGRMATGFVDPFLGGVKQTKMEGPEKLANTPIAGPVLGRFVSTSIDQQEESLTNQFYRDSQAAQQPLATLHFLEKNHPDQIPQYIQQHKDDLWKGKIATDMQNRLGTIQNAEKSIQQDNNMAPADKEQALKNIHDAKMQILSVFTKVMRPSPQVPQASAYPGQGQGAPH